MAFGSKNRVRVQGEFDDQISSKLDKLRDRFDTLGKSKGAQSILMGVGLGAGTMALNAVGAAVGKVGELAFAAIDDASNLAETVSKGRVIFGESAAEIEAWADTAAEAFGQSKRQAIDTAAGFAGLFNTVGLSLDQSADYAKDLTELGADLASFFNTDVDSALQALKSGLSGEAEPLKRFNVFLSETAVSAKLAEMGIKKTGGAFTEAQKATARYALIMEQTGSAQGDFARTSDGLANSQRTVSAQMEELSADVGEALLPVMLELANFANDTLIPALSDTVKWFKDNEWAINLLGDAFTFATQGPMGLAVKKTDEFRESQEKAAGGVLDTGKAVNTMAMGVTRDIGTVAVATDTLGRGFFDAAEVAATASKKISWRATQTRDEFWAAMSDIESKLQRTTDSMQSIVSGAMDAIYDPWRRASRLTTIEFEIDAQRRIKADSESTAEERFNADQRITDLKIERREIKSLQALLGELTGDTSEMRQRTVEDWAAASGEARAEIQKFIDKLYALERATNMDFTVSGGSLFGARQRTTTQQHRAHGGPVTAGEPYLVGEEGPELYVPERSGSIVPNDRLMRAGGGSADSVVVHTQINLDGREVARVVDRHLSYRTSYQPR